MSIYEKTFELLEATGLNWSVDKRQLQTKGGEETPSFGLFRADNNTYLGTVGNQYEPMQNSALAETIIEASEGVGLVSNRGGAMRGGRKVYIQAELPDEHIGASGLKRYITALNSHDGTMAIAFGSTNVVVICENTFYKAYKADGLSKYRHTSGARERIEEAMGSMKIAMEQEVQLIETFKRMADTGVDSKTASGIVERIFGRAFKVEPHDKLSPRKEKRVISMGEAIRREIGDHGPNLWGVFNGVTRYTNHIAAPKAEKLDYVMNGAGGTVNQIAYDILTDWMEQHGPKQHAVV